MLVENMEILKKNNYISERFYYIGFSIKISKNFFEYCYSKSK